jgi:hypothetical protein
VVQSHFCSRTARRQLALFKWRERTQRDDHYVYLMPGMQSREFGSQLEEDVSNLYNFRATGNGSLIDSNLLIGCSPPLLSTPVSEHLLDCPWRHYYKIDQIQSNVQHRAFTQLPQCEFEQR